MIDVFEELLTEYRDHVASCEKLIKEETVGANRSGWPNGPNDKEERTTRISRLRAKSDTYYHCAELLEQAIERARALEGGA